MPRIARRLRPADEAEPVERLLDDRGNLLRFGEAGARLRVDVDAKLVWVLDVAARDGQGWKSIVARFAAHATWASSVTHSSSAVRPEGT
jgi:hypothetical protein